MIHNARYLDETKNTQKTNNAHTKMYTTHSK